MIRVKGTRADGTPMILLVLEPENLERLVDDQPITIDLQYLAPAGVITRRLELVLIAAKDRADFVRIAKLFIEKAADDFGVIHVIPKTPEGEQ